MPDLKKLVITTAANNAVTRSRTAYTWGTTGLDMEFKIEFPSNSSMSSANIVWGGTAPHDGSVGYRMQFISGAYQIYRNGVYFDDDFTAANALAAGEKAVYRIRQATSTTFIISKNGVDIKTVTDSTPIQSGYIAFTAFDTSVHLHYIRNVGTGAFEEGFETPAVGSISTTGDFADIWHYEYGGTLSIADTGNKLLTVTSRSFTITRNNVNLYRNRLLTVTSRAFTLTRNNVNLLRTRLLTVTTRAYTWTRNSVNVLRNRLLSVTTRAFTLTRNNVGVNRGYPLTVTSRSVAITRNPVGLYAQRLLTVSGASYAVSGASVGVNRQYPLSVTSRSISASASVVNLYQHRLLTVTGQSYAVNGRTVTLLRQYPLTVTSRSVAVGTGPVNLTRQLLLTITKANMIVGANSAGLYAQRRLTVSPAPVGISASVVGLSYTVPGNYNLIVTAAQFQVQTRTVAMTAPEQASGGDGAIWRQKGRR